MSGRMHMHQSVQNCAAKWKNHPTKIQQHCTSTDQNLITEITPAIATNHQPVEPTDDDPGKPPTAAVPGMPALPFSHRTANCKRLSTSTFHILGPQLPLKTNGCKQCAIQYDPFAHL